MNFLRLLPVIISFLLLAAHFYRAGQLMLVLISVALLLLLVLKKSWIPWLMQVALLLGAIEWLRTLVAVAQVRIEFGMPWVRMAIILGVVALFTTFSSLIFKNKKLCKRYLNV